MRRWALLCGVGVALLGMLAALYIVFTRVREPREFRAIQVGMTGEEVSAIFGRRADGGWPEPDGSGAVWGIGNDASIVLTFRKGRVTRKELQREEFDFLEEVFQLIGYE
jgi:hypothetical protein